MALPKQTADKISAEINKEFGGWGWKAEVIGTENEVIVHSDEEPGEDRFGFGWKLDIFAKIVKGWSFTIMKHEGRTVLIIW